MKKLQSLSLIALAVFTLGAFNACKKDNSASSAVPVIKYVRITNPLSSDSLLVGAFQNNLIAIVGENLQSTKEIWFNDQRAVLTPTYISNNSILVSTPGKIPAVVTNKLTLIYGNNDTLLYDFKIQISEPVLTAMNSEYVLTGDVATIRGNFFYEPLKVTFEGGAEGELVSVADQSIKVKVPAGAKVGPITVSTNFGTTKSNFWFRDNRNIFISSDPFTGWWNQNYVVSNPGTNDPQKINGNYIRVKQQIGGWAWTEVAGGPASAMGDISKNIPDEAILKPENYNFKFEVNTRKPYNNNVIKFNLGILKENNDAYKWMPPYDTKGEWETVVIPFEEVAASYGTPLTVSPDGYWTRILFHGPGDLDADISFDNFRVVPKVSK